MAILTITTNGSGPSDNLVMDLTDNYPSTICKPDFVEEMQSERIENGYELDVPEYCGYSLIRNCLIHETFIQRVIYEIESCKFESGFIFDEEYLFSIEFLESLDDQEKDVLMGVALLLLKQRIKPEVYEDMYACMLGGREI
jgi:hypothetical protein